MTAAAVGMSLGGIPANVLLPKKAEQEPSGDGGGGGGDGGGASEFDIWSAIQSQKAAVAAPMLYVHPLVRRSSSSLSQMSLDTCTESLGSETGSDDIFDESHDHRREEAEGKTGAVAVNYPCGGTNGRKASSRRRSFPPPLPSICRRDGPCFAMKRHRSDGRLVVEAVLVPSINYLHADRRGGRLLLSFVTTAATARQAENVKAMNQIDDEDEDVKAMEEEEEVEVVDRGTVVEVKVSTQPQKKSGAAAKVLRSSIVINKFVGGGGAPLIPAGGTDNDATEQAAAQQLARAASATSPPRRLPSTAAAAAVVASSLSAAATQSDNDAPAESKLLLFASRSRSKDELLHNMRRRCSELRRPLFFWEPCCIATSS